MATSVVKKIRRSGRVGIYVHVNSAGREHLKSLAAQVSSLTRYVSNQEGWVLIDIYMDAGLDRAEFDRLVNDCKSHNLEAVIVESLSSFGKDNGEVAEAVRLLHECGVKIEFMGKDLDVCGFPFPLKCANA